MIQVGFKLIIPIKYLNIKLPKTIRIIHRYKKAKKKTINMRIGYRNLFCYDNVILQ